MTTSVEQSAANYVGPYKNTATMISLWMTDVDNVSDVTDLSTVFGQIGEGEFFDICNDSDTVTIYVALGAASGTIAPAATGTGVTVCWPIPPNTTISRRILSGQTWLHYITASSTSTIRVARTSTPPGVMPAKAFPAP